MNPSPLSSTERFCVFHSGDGWYGIPALSIQRVEPRPSLTRAPHCDPVLRGLCHVQNEFVPVFSLLAITQIQYEVQPNSEQQLLLMAGPSGSWGLLIDQTLGLADLETSYSSFSDQGEAWSKVTVGSASYRNQVLQILDPTATYQYAINLLDRFWMDQEKVGVSFSKFHPLTA